MSIIFSVEATFRISAWTLTLITTLSTLLSVGFLQTIQLKYI